MEKPESNKVNRTPPISKSCFPPEHLVAFYTLLKILMKMKKELGLEAMLEYMAKYIESIDSHNPTLAKAIAGCVGRSV
jgi:hypothetical protein